MKMVRCTVFGGFALWVPRKISQEGKGRGGQINNLNRACMSPHFTFLFFWFFLLLGCLAPRAPGVGRPGVFLDRGFWFCLVNCGQKIAGAVVFGRVTKINPLSFPPNLDITPGKKRLACGSCVPQLADFSVQFWTSPFSLPHPPPPKKNIEVHELNRSRGTRRLVPFRTARLHSDPANYPTIHSSQFPAFIRHMGASELVKIPSFCLRYISLHSDYVTRPFGTNWNFHYLPLFQANGTITFHATCYTLRFPPFWKLFCFLAIFLGNRMNKIFAEERYIGKIGRGNPI